MSIQESYEALARLLEYPDSKEGLIESSRKVSAFLDQRGVPSAAGPFAETVGASPLASLQEDYVANFDFNPAVAPYLGHHLYGDNQKKAAFMISVKQEFRRFGFAPVANELPDHLAVLLSFLAHLTRLGEDTFRRRFIEDLVLPGLENFVAACTPRNHSPWLALVETARLLCCADCQEAATC